LPMAILQSTSGSDRYRVALLSAGTRWLQVQWGTSAVVDGSYGQGFQSEFDKYELLSDALLSSDSIPGWQQADNIFSRYRILAMNALDGTPISDTGFF
jgi:hypothetical protein